MGPRPVLEGDDVLLLVTLALVVASAVLLILGFVQDALGFIYLSMVCAGVAALALFVFARLAKRRGAALVGAGVGSSPYADDQHAGQPPAGDLVGADDPTQGVATVPAPSRTVASDGESGSWYDEEESADETDVAAAWSAAGPGDDDWGDEVVFPIEDYDDLRVAEILPLLSQLDPDELQEVRDRELAGKARATILDRIDDRLSRDAAGPASAVTTAAIPVVEPLGTGEPSAPGAPAFEPSGADGGAAPESAPASSRSRSSRKATGATGAAKKTPAKKAPAAKKTPAKKAPAAKRTAAAPAPAEAGVAPADAGVAPADAGVAPAEPPARKASPRKVAAAVTEPAPPSTTARRTASTRKPATAPPQPAAGTGAVGGSTEPVQPAEGAQAVEPAQTEPAASIQPSDPMQPVGPIRPAGPSEATGSGQPAEQADAAPPAKAARRTTKKAAGRTAPTKAVGEAAPAKKAGPARRPTKKTE